ncbi:MAG: cytochrome b/b6 domain-containing protein, partial [Acetobacteraceae bacterium]
LYGLLVCTPVLGYLTAATAPVQVPTLFMLVVNVPHVVGPNPWWFSVLRPIHRTFAITLMVLAAGHAAMALQHHRRGHPLLLAMWRG